MKPIICNSESVRAILDGRKSQTRRVIKPQPVMCFGCQTCAFRCDHFITPPKEKYQVGMKLWVRETWQAIDDIYIGGPDHAGHYVPDDEPDRRDIPDSIRNIIQETAEIFYKADNVSAISHWRPSIHMPKWASRITLEIKDTKVERVQDIKPIDTVVEGVYEPHYNYTVVEGIAAILEYEQVWNAINAKKGFGWDTNPWAWVLEFEKCSS